MSTQSGFQLMVRVRASISQEKPDSGLVDSFQALCIYFWKGLQSFQSP